MHLPSPVLSNNWRHLPLHKANPREYVILVLNTQQMSSSLSTILSNCLKTNVSEWKLPVEKHHTATPRI